MSYPASIETRTSTLLKWHPFWRIIASDAPDLQQFAARCCQSLCDASEAHGCVLVFGIGAGRCVFQSGEVEGALVEAAGMGVLPAPPRIAAPEQLVLAFGPKFPGYVVLINSASSPDDLRSAVQILEQSLARISQRLEEQQRVTRLVSQLRADLRRERGSRVRREIEIRTQIGRDLHDGPIQQVAVAELEVQFFRRVLQHAPEKVPAAIDDLQSQLKRTLYDLRSVLYELRPLGIEERGIGAIVQEYVDRIEKSARLAFHLEIAASLPRLDPDRETAIFIIVQEAINNIRKHAKADDIWIRVFASATSLIAEVQDNGIGFDAETRLPTARDLSYGLLNMRDRATLIGGSCTITSAFGNGTTVRVEVPLVSTPLMTPS